MNRFPVKTVLVALLLGLLSVLDAYATREIFTSRYPGGNDFYPRWRGAQLYWLEGADPYSEQASLAIQEGIYGRPAHSGEDQVLFAYPFYTVFLLLPLMWLDYAWAHAVWMVALEFALVGGTVLCLKLVDWRGPSWLLVVTALWAVTFYHSVRTIVLGQFAGLVFLWTVGALWLLRRQRDMVAGFLLALTAVKPQMSFLLIPALLLWGVGQRRWRFVAAFGVAMALLAGVSFILLPSWMGEFVRQVVLYPSYTKLGSPVWIVTHRYLPWLGTPVEIGVSVLIVLYLLVQWRHLPCAQVDSGMFQWLIGLTLIVTNLAVVRTATTNYVVLYIPLFLALKVATDRFRRRSLLVTVFYLLSVIGMWALFSAAYEDREPMVMYLVAPLTLLVVFLGGRKALQKVVL